MLRIDGDTSIVWGQRRGEDLGFCDRETLRTRIHDVAELESIQCSENEGHLIRRLKPV